MSSIAPAGAHGGQVTQPGNHLGSPGVGAGGNDLGGTQATDIGSCLEAISCPNGGKTVFQQTVAVAGAGVGASCSPHMHICIMHWVDRPGREDHRSLDQHLVRRLLMPHF